jgi:hypothetical protein
MVVLTRRPGEAVVIGGTVLCAEDGRTRHGLRCAKPVRPGDADDDGPRFDEAWDRAGEATWDAVSGVWA